jgi:outer membrane protein assembly factor BamD (BamD/ComL family)
VKAVVAAVWLSAAAQCGADEVRYADPPDPAEALYENAAHLREAGNVDGADETLRFLIRRYPGSRYSERARMDLERRNLQP